MFSSDKLLMSWRVATFPSARRLTPGRDRGGLLTGGGEGKLPVLIGIDPRGSVGRTCRSQRGHRCRFECNAVFHFAHSRDMLSHFPGPAFLCFAVHEAAQLN